MKLNLRQIEVFRALMISGSITGAAELLFVSPAAISRLISYTEQRIGLTLFRRTKGRLYPTPEAQRLFVEVTSVYETVQRVNEVADFLVENREGQIRIACNPNLAHYLLPKAITAFRRQYPSIRVILHTLTPQLLQQALLERKTELAIAHIPVVHPSLTSIPLSTNEIVAVLPIGHPLSDKKILTVHELRNEPLIGYTFDIPFGTIVRSLFGSDDAYPVPCIEVQLAHTACALVQEGAGIALVDAMTVKGLHWPNVISVPIENTINVPVNILHVQLEPLSRLSQAFIETLKDVASH